MKWVAVVLLAAAVAGCVWLTTHVEPYRVYVVGDFDGRARGWEVLLPWAAGPVLAAYGAPVLALACALGWVVAKTRMAEERQRIAKREAAAEARLRQGEGRKQEAQAAAAEFRRERSVKTNIGLHRQVQKLKGEAEPAAGIGYNGPLLKTPISSLIQRSFHGVSFPEKRAGSLFNNPEHAVLPENRGEASPRIHALIPSPSLPEFPVRWGD